MSAILEIGPDDEIARCIIFSPIFEGTLHTDAALWRFGKTLDDGASHHSAILRRLAPTESDVHAAGCKIAAMQNAAKGEPEPGDRRRYYCGFRSAQASRLSHDNEDFRIILSHLPENGLDAHVDVALTVFGKTKSEQANQRTLAGMILAEASGPPVAHICDCDAEDEMQPLRRFGPDCLLASLRDRFPSLHLYDMPDAANDTGPHGLINDAGGVD